MKNRKFTAQFKAEIARRAHAGESPTLLAKEHNITPPQIYAWKRHYPRGVAQEPQEPVQKYRKERVPMHKQVGQIILGDDTEYIHRGVAEDDRRLGRVEQFKLAGWEPITRDQVDIDLSNMAYAETPGSTVTRAAGMGTTMTFMRKRREFEEEDLKSIEAANEKKEESIYRQVFEEGRTGRVTLNKRTEER